MCNETHPAILVSLSDGCDTGCKKRKEGRFHSACFFQLSGLLPPGSICIRAMDISRLPRWQLVTAFLLVLCNKVGAIRDTCNSTQARECYTGIMDSVLKEFSQHPFSISRLDGLCAEHDAKSTCAVDLADCFDSDPTLGALEKLYATARDEACSDPNRSLLKTLVPSAKCSALQLLTTCVEKRLQEFDNSSEEIKSNCKKTTTTVRRWTPRPRVQLVESLVTDPPWRVPASSVLQSQFDWSDDLEAELTRCLISVGPPCRPNRQRPRYARRTLAMLLEMKGCTPSDNNPFLQSDDMQMLNDQVQPDSSQVLCSYKQLKRCLEKQINDIQRKTADLVKKGRIPNDHFMASICRKTRKTCYQHNRVVTCDAGQQDAIKRMEEAMNLAQAMLCENNRTLLENLLLSYKSWNIQGFAQCSRDVQVNSITDHLYLTQRIDADCSKLKSRVYRCLNESYASVEKNADPQPDVAGAVKVLAAFLDRLKCVAIGDLPQQDGGADSTSDYNDVDYPAEDESVSVTTTKAPKEPPNAADVLKPRTSVSVVLTSLAFLPLLHQRLASTY